MHLKEQKWLEKKWHAERPIPLRKAQGDYAL